jgi:RNA polymerase sigma-70 factor (ECF subfamily)
MVNDFEAGSDIVQEVFICFYNDFTNGNQIKYPKSWLYRVTSNKCIDYLKKKNKFQNIEAAGDLREQYTSIEERETIAIVRAALSKLNPKERLLAVLYAEGLSYKEISEATKIKFVSVGKMLSRTLKKLEKELKRMNHEMY